MGTVPQAAQYTIKMVCRLENLGQLDVCDRECAWQTFIHINCVHIYRDVSDFLWGNVLYIGKVSE